MSDHAPSAIIINQDKATQNAIRDIFPYEMSFASFVGVNHHGQPILFGCRLICKENTKIFKWLFKS